MHYISFHCFMSCMFIYRKSVLCVFAFYCTMFPLYLNVNYFSRQYTTRRLGDCAIDSKTKIKECGHALHFLFIYCISCYSEPADPPTEDSERGLPSSPGLWFLETADGIWPNAVSCATLTLRRDVALGLVSMELHYNDKHGLNSILSPGESNDKHGLNRILNPGESKRKASVW